MEKVLCTQSSPVFMFFVLVGESLELIPPKYRGMPEYKRYSRTFLALQKKSKKCLTFIFLLFPSMNPVLSLGVCSKWHI